MISKCNVRLREQPEGVGHDEAERRHGESNADQVEVGPLGQQAVDLAGGSVGPARVVKMLEAEHGAEHEQPGEGNDGEVQAGGDVAVRRGGARVVVAEGQEGGCNRCERRNGCEAAFVRRMPDVQAVRVGAAIERLALGQEQRVDNYGIGKREARGEARAEKSNGGRNA